MKRAAYTLKVNTVKRTEKAGKPDTFSISLEGSTPAGVGFTLTVTGEDLGELKRIVPTVPGALVELALAEVRYGNIENYGQVEAPLAKVLEEDLEEPPAMQADPYQAPGEPASEPRKADQAEALEARRRAWQKAQEASQDPDLDIIGKEAD